MKVQLCERSKRFGRIKDRDMGRWIGAVELFLVLAACTLHAARAGHYADFYPINGTFQNFNPVRGLLNGQVPCRDFQDYLGLGHLYTGSLCTALLGGDYQASLVAFSFLTIVSLVLTLTVIGGVILRKRTDALVLSNLFLLILLIRPSLFLKVPGVTEMIVSSVAGALETGNSARFIRGMILPISCFLLMGVFKVTEKLNGSRRGAAAICGTALVSGFAFVWSNDYGISCWVCMAVMTFWIVLARTRDGGRALLGVGMETALSLACIYVCIQILTLGHFAKWMESVLGTGGYQAWYFNSEKSHYLYNVDVTPAVAAQALVCLIYMAKLFGESGEREAILRYGIPAFANMTGFCAVNEYKLLSGNNSRGMALSILFITYFFEVCCFIRPRLGKNGLKHILWIGTTAAGGIWILFALKSEMAFWRQTDREGIYIAQMGGNMTALYPDLEETSDFLDGEPFFATYASAQEVMEDTYQPSGTDYIIHVLGDKPREEYLRVFEEGDFRYAATMREEYTLWEFWVQRANWFFYRELYRNWHPVFANTYEMYWERNERDDNRVSGDFYVSVGDVDDWTKKIIVRTDGEVNGIADLYVEYDVQKNEGLRPLLLFQSMVRAQNTGAVYASHEWYESNYLRPSGSEYIPVTVTDGYGEVILSSCPEDDTFLEIHGASCSDIFTVTFDYVEVHGAANVEGKAAISIKREPRAEKTVNNARYAVVDGKSYGIDEIKSDDNYLYLLFSNGMLLTDREGKLSGGGNMIRIVR